MPALEYAASQSKQTRAREQLASTQ